MPELETVWVVENLNDLVDTEFDALPKDIQAKFMHLAALVEDVGLPALREPYVKHLQGKLWELRVKAKSGLGRGLYCTITGKRVGSSYATSKSSQERRRAMKSLSLWSVCGYVQTLA